jgi:hypothetical protein
MKKIPVEEEKKMLHSYTMAFLCILPSSIVVLVVLEITTPVARKYTPGGQLYWYYIKHKASWEYITGHGNKALTMRIEAPNEKC